MKLVFIFVFVVLALATAADDVPNEDILTASQLKNDNVDKRITSKTRSIQGRGIFSSNGKIMVENFINRLPCGWPDAGIPPLAPYAKKNIDLEYKYSFAELSQKFEYFRMDGLDIMLIERMKIGYIFSKYAKFNLDFPKLIFSGKYITKFFIDLMKEYGISVQFDGKGDFEFMLEEIIINGFFKYKMPLAAGHTKIYNFDISLYLGNVKSNIRGIGGNGKINRLINDKIEEIALHIVNFNQYKISQELEKILVPFINEKLKGRNVWTFIGSLIGQKGKICYPPPYPW